MGTILKLNELTKKYGNKVVVDNLNIEIQEGEVFGLLGPNGAGKSTTMNMICDLVKPTLGNVEFFGKDFQKNRKELVDKLGYIPQDLAIHGNLKAWENVELFTSLYGIKGAELKKRIDESLEYVGLLDRRNDFAKTFSGGMKRRLNIACAIGHHPKLLIFDEPTVGIDPQSRNFILDKIKESNRNGATVIYTSHYMEEVEAICRIQKMNRYLIKNNIKLMYRSWGNILLFVIMPVILVFCLSSAFDTLMSKYEETDMTAGYRIEGDGITQEMLDAMIDVAEENDLTLNEYPTGDPEELIRDNGLTGFIVFEDDTYTLYEDNSAKGKVLEYFVNAFYENAAAAAMGVDTDAVKLTVEHPEYRKTIDSKDYYGIVEIIYFGWCAIVAGAGIFMNEKKYKIRKRYQVANLTPFKEYMSKFIPIAIIASIGTVIAALLTVALLGVHWGSPLLSIGIIVISVAAASAFGIMIYNMTDNMISTIIITFVIVWLFGFWGGAFETYLFSSHPMILKMISPIYHINRALTELSCMGHSNYVGSAVGYSGLIIAAASCIAILFGQIRKRGRA